MERINSKPAKGSGESAAGLLKRLPEKGSVGEAAT